MCSSLFAASQRGASGDQLLHQQEEERSHCKGARAHTREHRKRAQRGKKVRSAARALTFAPHAAAMRAYGRALATLLFTTSAVGVQVSGRRSLA